MINTIGNGQISCGSLYTIMGDARIIAVVTNIEQAVGDRGWVNTRIQRKDESVLVEVVCTFKFDRPEKTLTSGVR